MTDQAGDLGELAMNLHNQSDVLTTVNGVLEFAVQALRYDHASVLLVERKHARTFAATDELITTADQLQIDLGEGPSLLAITDQDDVLVEDTTHGHPLAQVGAHRRRQRNPQLAGDPAVHGALHPGRLEPGVYGAFRLQRRRP
jgi:hypothetical protein